ncbi:MAG: sulfite exporter TauE/SafE family protein [Bacteroidia bacterium]|nr:sulfite exporter TauE/SafE family protein [Bacteroidia bacterium]MDW8345576.1 sulfite exporter TauE/SafE family protein [Bacteroidia bacterium]
MFGYFCAILDWIAIFTAGLFSSLAHCVGMCGGFVAHLSTQPNTWQKQIAYHIGRVFIYTFWGLLSGVLSRILLYYGENSIIQNLISIIAGSIMIVIALQSVRILPKWSVISGENKFFVRLFRVFIQDKNYLSGLYLGFLTGFLPCTLLWGFVAYAASKPNIQSSVWTMFIFALSTVLPLLLLGFLTHKLTTKFRLGLHYIASIILLLLGLITILRGVPWIMMNFHYYVMKYGLMIHPE